MKIVAISDTHDQHRRIVIPKCDVLIHAGDAFCHREPIKEKYDDFMKWFASQDVKRKILVPGNHDTCFQKWPAYLLPANVDVLIDSGVMIDGVSFWGSPWTLPWDNWAFQCDEKEIEKHLKNRYDFNNNTIDIFITHGPPKNILDMGDNNIRFGSETIAREVEWSSPIYHVFGHAHNSYGIVTLPARCNRMETHYVNCSQVWEGNVPRYRPFIFEV